MSDPETPNQPLLRASAAEGGRPSKAYKVAGITLLACVLIAGQAMVAYFLLSQRSDIRSLEEQSNNLKAALTKGRSVSAPIRMDMPMNALPKMMDDFVDEEASTGAPEKSAPQPATDCQLEAAHLKAVQVPGFQPSCDERGLYKAQQCYIKHCWCVNPVNGQQIPGSLREGPVRCRAPVFAGSMSKVLTLPDVEV
ncbi:insulin-like growth factor-binding protein 2 [Morone saxatilis]|uniref:insulin-like growth factor-binding protein 2 n=1 Tax=Morone saxatilis TaxID=34816 RepID=UPI0015E20C50|nr:insulin-like growth factor-binding protein 2 [Morone saxatilis]XP_035519244.1 insulin-like growth factor-binding protein 2 [Morone saxatilis]